MGGIFEDRKNDLEKDAPSVLGGACQKLQSTPAIIYTALWRK